MLAEDNTPSEGSPTTQNCPTVSYTCMVGLDVSRPEAMHSW